jgi:hypothetical protein
LVRKPKAKFNSISDFLLGKLIMVRLSLQLQALIG